MSVDNNQTKELFNLMYEVRDRTTRIEAETSRLGIIEKTANKADGKANEALLRAKSNEKEIDSTQSNIRWLWGTAITIVLGVAGIFLKIVI